MAAPIPPSPGVGARRKGPKNLPKLPISAFSPPNTGTSDSFPLPPDPSTVHPAIVIDAQVAARAGSINYWAQQAGDALGGKSGGVVVSLQGTSPTDVEKTITALTSSSKPSPILSIIIPFDLESGPPSAIPNYITASKIPIALSTTYRRTNPKHGEGIRWALDAGYTVEIDVQTELQESESAFGGLDDLLGKALHGQEESGPPKGKIILSNILPPKVPLTIPIVKLINDPIYRAYQAHIATLSLFPSVSIKCLPPSWDAPTPHAPPPSADAQTPVMSPGGDTPIVSREKKEWMRRIKMYLGPAFEAFGYERIVFGSSPSSAESNPSNPGDWYEIARESFAELGIDQEDIDALFGGNAKKVYQ